MSQTIADVLTWAAAGRTVKALGRAVVLRLRPGRTVQKKASVLLRERDLARQTAGW